MIFYLYIYRRISLTLSFSADILWRKGGDAYALQDQNIALRQRDNRY